MNEERSLVMGADGHIKFYDKLKVDKICKELRIKHKYPVRFPLIICNFTVNGKACYLDYWEEGGHINCGLDREYGAYPQHKKYIWDELKKRCNSEAILVEDVEIWT